jgi:hypothetical protein
MEEGSMIMAKQSPQSMGGHARAAKLSEERRSEIGRQSALVRWNKIIDPTLRLRVVDAWNKGDRNRNEIAKDFGIPINTIGTYLFWARNQGMAVRVSQRGILPKRRVSAPKGKAA